MSQFPVISVVLTSGGTDEDLTRTADQLIAGLPGQIEIVIVRPGTSEDTASGGSRYNVAHDPKDDGQEGARRLSASSRAGGASLSTGKVLLFCAAPLEFEPGWAEPLLEVLVDRSVGAVSPVLVSFADHDRPVGGLTFVDSVLNTRWLPAPPSTGPVPILPGCFIAIRRELLDRIGDIDSVASDDFANLDLCLRIWRAGYECMVVPTSRVAHDFLANDDQPVDWDNFIYNLVRLGALHLDESDLTIMLSYLAEDSSLTKAIARVISDDTPDRRKAIAKYSTADAGVILRRLCGEIFSPITAPSAAHTSIGESNGGNSLMEDGRSYVDVNRQAWAYWAKSGTHTSKPVEQEDLVRARETLDPWGWLPWDRIRRVLCLASAGGQQAPLFASLGCEVTLVDISPDQLNLDRAVAADLGLSLEILEGDMLDLGLLKGRRFDLVFQPTSACYVPDVNQLYGEVAKALTKDGLYLVEHWSPTQMQLEGPMTWDGTAYRMIHPQGSGRPIPWQLELPDGTGTLNTWHYIHRLQDLVGGLIRAGFTIHELAERPLGDPEAEQGTPEHLATFVPSFIRILAKVGQIEGLKNRF
jgi:SAM-dependent methyltransferase